MSALKRWDITGSAILQQLLNKKALENFRPGLHFYDMWEKSVYWDGYNTIAWARFTKLDVTVANATLSDGVTPNDTAFDATLVTTTPTQYGLVVRLSDMLLKTAWINFLTGAMTEVWANMATIIDKVIQTEIMAGTNVKYTSTDHNTRATLDNTDTMLGSYITHAVTTLETNSAPKIDGYYVGIMHPKVTYDLKNDTNVTGWLEAHKYTTPENIFKGEIWAINGARIVSSPSVQTFASTVTVYPTLLMWRGAYGVANLDALQTYMNMPKVSDSDPLAQRASVGAKVAFSAKRLQEDSMIRMESWTTFA